MNWLQDKYAAMFESHGYQDTTFIAGMDSEDLQRVGVKSKPHRQKLLAEIRELPDYDVDPAVPVSALPPSY